MSRISLLCGALTLVAAASYAPPALAAQTVRCESSDGRYSSCEVDTRGGVRLSRQLSSQGCWQNDTWGYDSNRIWVTNGCRAEFTVGDYQHESNNSGAVAGVAIAALIGAALLANKDKDRDRYDDGHGGYDPRTTFRCESVDRRQVYCPIPSRGHVEVYRQVSDSACQYGVTWGVDGRNVWVNEGCRADFAVY